MKVQAMPVDLRGIARLRPEIFDGTEASRCDVLAEADRFEEGQISGPFGPKFVGYGEVEMNDDARPWLPWLLGCAFGLAAVVLGLAR